MHPSPENHYRAERGFFRFCAAAAAVSLLVATVGAVLLAMAAGA